MVRPSKPTGKKQSTKLIRHVKLSRHRARVGESVLVTVETSTPDVQVEVNGIAGALQYIQFRNEGTYTVSITASLGTQVEQIGQRVDIRPCANDENNLPIIWAAFDRYQPRTIVFSIANADELGDVLEYLWDFGDGTQGKSDVGSISHDYSDALLRDSVITNFHVRTDARHQDGTMDSVLRTIAVLHFYALNKTEYGVLAPRVSVLPVVVIPIGLLFTEVLCNFTVQNLEDEELSFTAERHEWLVAESESSNLNMAVSEFASEALSPTTRQVANAFINQPAIDLRVPPRSTVTVTRIFPWDSFKGDVFGVAIHLTGVGTCSKLQAVASAYVEVKLPLKYGGYVIDNRLHLALNFLSRASTRQDAVVTHMDFNERIRQQTVLSTTHASSAATGRNIEVASGATSTDQVDFTQPPAQRGKAISANPTSLLNFSDHKLNAIVNNLLDPNLIPFDIQDIVYGSECDPDNLPDNLPEGAVCQLTGEYAWRYVPGRILNAKKGDLLNDPGGPGPIGQLLRQVSQHYAHCGIMTKNHIEMRHSTGSDDWLMDNTSGELLGNKGTDGFISSALKYLWPGTVTQSIDQAYYGQWISGPPSGNYPSGNQYKIADFSFAPDTSNRTAIVYPLVVKPPPFDETAAVRLKLHSVAGQALAINGHYRFYCYTKPEIALNADGIAGADSGWAQGTVATVCSSFIWLAAKRAGVQLEGPGAVTKAEDLEPKDINAGAAADGSTLDGLYHYTSEQRQAAAKVLYQRIYDEAHNKAGFWGTLFTDAPDDVANQVCNTFASDWSDDDAKSSDAWKHTGPANAVSPDNMMFWDSPTTSNQGQFKSVYGYIEEAFYRPGTYARVPIYRWKHVETRGNLTGTVVANGDLTGANVSLLGSGMQDFVVQSDGRFHFDNVPAGDYTVSAGLNINGYFNTADVAAHIVTRATTNVTITLAPPPEVNRLVTINVEMTTDWKSVWAHSPRYYNDTKSVRLNPFNSRDFLGFDGSELPHGHILFDIRLNADLSITVAWTAQEIDDEVEGEVKGGYTIAKDGVLNWSGLTVVNDDPIDADWTTMNFSIRNELASA